MSVANYGYISPYADAVEVVNGVAVVRGNLQVLPPAIPNQPPTATVLLVSPGVGGFSGTQITSNPFNGCEINFASAGVAGGSLLLDQDNVGLYSPTQSTILSVQNAGVLISGSGHLSISTLTVSTINGAPTVSELFNRFYQANPSLSTISLV